MCGGRRPRGRPAGRGDKSRRLEWRRTEVNRRYMAFLPSSSAREMESVARVVVPKSGKIAEKEGKRERKNEREERESYLRSSQSTQSVIRLSQDTFAPMNQKFAISRELSWRHRRGATRPVSNPISVSCQRGRFGGLDGALFLPNTRLPACMRRILRFMSAAK